MLRRHVTLLHRYAEQAFDGHDEAYLGEVAAKLRLLAVKEEQGDPLLIRLMAECGLHLSVTALQEDGLSLPPDWAERVPPGTVQSLTEHLDLPAVKVTMLGGGEKTLSKREFIELLAEKCGAAHEDWDHPAYLTEIRDSDLRIKGYAPIAAVLKPITTAVLDVADHALRCLTPPVIEAAEQRRGARLWA